MCYAVNIFGNWAFDASLGIFGRRSEEMDILFIGIIIFLAMVSFGFVVLCSKV